MKDYNWWKERVGQPACSYYDGPMGHNIEDVRQLPGYGKVEIKVNGRWFHSIYMSIDRDGERWVHPDIEERKAQNLTTQDVLDHITEWRLTSPGECEMHFASDPTSKRDVPFSHYDREKSLTSE